MLIAICIWLAVAAKTQLNVHANFAFHSFVISQMICYGHKWCYCVSSIVPKSRVLDNDLLLISIQNESFFFQLKMGRLQIELLKSCSNKKLRVYWSVSRLYTSTVANGNKTEFLNFLWDCRRQFVDLESKTKGINCIYKSAIHLVQIPMFIITSFWVGAFFWYALQNQLDRLFFCLEWEM